MKILLRRPRKDGGKYFVIQRRDRHHPFASAISNETLIRQGRWFWGHYFRDLDEAITDFQTRRT